MATYTTKTYFLHLSDEAVTDDRQLPNGTYIKAADNNEHLNVLPCGLQPQLV